MDTRDSNSPMGRGIAGHKKGSKGLVFKTDLGDEVGDDTSPCTVPLRTLPKTPKSPRPAMLLMEGQFPENAPKLTKADFETLIEDAPCTSKSYSVEAILKNKATEGIDPQESQEGWVKEYYEMTDDYYDRHYMLKKSNRVAEYGGRNWGNSIKNCFVVIMPIVATLFTTITLLMITELMSQVQLKDKSLSEIDGDGPKFLLLGHRRNRSMTKNLHINSVAAFLMSTKQAIFKTNNHQRGLGTYIDHISHSRNQTSYVFRNDEVISNGILSDNQKGIYMWLFLLLVVPNFFSLMLNFFASGAREKKRPKLTYAIVSLLLGIIESLGECILVYCVAFDMASSSKYAVLILLVSYAGFGNPLAVFMKNISYLRRAVYLIGTGASIGVFISFLALSSLSLNDSVSKQYSNVSYIFLAITAGALLSVPWAIKYLGFYETRYYTLGYIQQISKLLSTILISWCIWFMLYKENTGKFWTESWANMFIEVNVFVPAILAAGISFFVFLSTIMSISICMQVAGFAIPMVISPVLAGIVIYLRCTNYSTHGTIGDKSETCDTNNATWQLVLLSVGHLTSILANHHIFIPTTFPLPLNRAVWHRMLYSSFFVSAIPILNRRQGVLKIRMNRKIGTHYSAKNSLSHQSITIGKISNDKSLANKTTDGPTKFKLSALWKRGKDNHSKSKKHKRPHINALGDYMEIDVNKMMSSTRKPSKKSLEAVYDATIVFLCTTMWHENEKEIDHLIRSFLRVDRGRKSANDTTYYESHVFFDDAFDADGACNEYVQTFLEHIYLYCDYDSICSNNNNNNTNAKNTAVKYMATPYGSQVTATFPYGLVMNIHLKDKIRIRNKKRWSQVMYLFYIMKYRVARDNIDLTNTYILTTDGDVEFDVPSMRDLLFYLKRNELVGGVCSRIFPLGKGPIAWFQMFEYALGHWLTKPAEQILGSVLCLPGCFSMFRCNALEEVMHMYTSEASNAKEFLQFDQGEDRWLTTLLLKKGWLLQYASSADAYTFCPMDFNEFFNQRRRWLTSTIANLIDLVTDQDLVVACNISIGKYFLHYQALLLGASVISPAISVITIAIGSKIIFDINEIITCLVFSVLIIIYTLVCLNLQQKTQLIVAQVYTYAFAGIMIFTVTGLTIALVRNVGKPGIGLAMILVIVVIVVFASLFHPRESHNILFGAIYLLYLPSISIVLLIYSLAQIDNVSWGTREGKAAKAIVIESDLDKLKLFLRALWDEVLSIFVRSDRKKRDLDQVKTNDTLVPEDEYLGEKENLLADEMNVVQLPEDINCIDDDDTCMRLVYNKELSRSEVRFWKTLMNRHLDSTLAKMYHDLYANDMFTDLRSLRESAVSGIVLLNGFFICIYCALAFQDRLFILENNPLLLVLSAFSIFLLLQFCCMLVHRWQMLAHVIATGVWYNQGQRSLKTTKQVSSTE